MSNSSHPIPAKSTLIDLYRRMALIKLNDERFRATIKAGKIVAPYYSPRGQEVIPAAVSVNLSDADYICTIYRGIHDMLAQGLPVKLLWAVESGFTTAGAVVGSAGASSCLAGAPLAPIKFVYT